MFKRETRCRALRLQLALLAYRAEHGELPSDLKQLVPKELPKLPADLYSGQQFLYRPAGMPYPIAKEPRSGRATDVTADSEGAMKPGTPFLCSIGPYIVMLHQIGLESEEPDVGDMQLRTEQPASPLRSDQEEFWHAAWCFPIP